ncbi:MAG: hypothetical protein LBU87_01965 [Lactobacillales bacterium]|jgi:hypothetical protein|nr:hypothetical protein [Lactobacillales bacterium]
MKKIIKIIIGLILASFCIVTYCNAAELVVCENYTQAMSEDDGCDVYQYAGD